MNERSMALVNGIRPERRQTIASPTISKIGRNAMAIAALFVLAHGPSWLAAQAPAARDQSVHMIAVENGGARYWPRWRGPSGQGLATDTGYVDTWSDKDNVLWRTRVPGRGHSSPIIWGDYVFLTTAYPDGRVSVLAYRRSDGKPLWEAFAPDRSQEFVHPKNSHASGTATTDGAHVFASFGSKGVLAVDFDGKVIWHRSLGAIDNYHGTASSPLLYQDKLILFQDHYRGGFVTALDATTGKPLWRTPRRGSVGWSTPVAIRAFDHDEIIVSSESRVFAYDPDTGRELWSARGNLPEVIPTPVVGHGLVFCASGRAGPTLAIKPGGSGDGTTTHIAWSSPRGSPFVPSPLLYGDALYLLNDKSSNATALDAPTGKLLLQGRTSIGIGEGVFG